MSKEEQPKPTGQYGIVDINGFAIAYGKTAEEFNKISRELLKKGFYPKEYKVHNLEKEVHFVQYYYINTGEQSEIKVSMVSSTEDVMLIHEKDVRIFNDKVAQALKNSYKMVLNNQGQQMMPSEKKIGEDFYFTIWMVKSRVSNIQIAPASALKNTDFKPGRFN